MVLDSLDKKATKFNGQTLPFIELRRALKYLFDNIYFRFNNKAYRQKTGTPIMGLKPPPIFADMVKTPYQIVGT